MSRLTRRRVFWLFLIACKKSPKWACFRLLPRKFRLWIGLFRHLLSSQIGYIDALIASIACKPISVLLRLNYLRFLLRNKNYLRAVQKLVWTASWPVWTIAAPLAFLGSRSLLSRISLCMLPAEDLVKASRRIETPLVVNLLEARLRTYKGSFSVSNKKTLASSSNCLSVRLF